LKNPWNWCDWILIGLQIAYINYIPTHQDHVYDHKLANNLYSLIIFFSWLVFMGFFRYIGDMRIFIALVSACIAEMTNFLIFMLIFLLSFTSVFFFEEKTAWTKENAEDFFHDHLFT